ncbi:sensor histidine kinase [Tropicibacter sp. S64]|uniref:sensor histidine kinase n=1 Tax=Tropicibacter sp. S64 TaxID=3415122 RepID=UPI003C7A1AED
MKNHLRENIREIERLYKVEYGDRPEAIIRMVGVGLGGAMFYLYTGWPLAWSWPLVFYACHGIFYAYLRHAMHKPAPRSAYVASALFLCVMLSFLWLPAYLAAQTDTHLSYVGTLLIATLIIYLIRRGDTFFWTLIAEIVAILLCLAAILVTKLETLTAPVEGLAMIVVTLAISGYLVQGIFAGRRLRLSSEAAAEKALQEQKLAAIGQLAGGVAHDFNNVLTAIGGNLELYEHIDDPAERDHVIGEARAATTRAAEVVRQLLIYARKAPTHRTAVDLSACVTELTKLSRSLITENVRLTLDLPPKPLLSHVDESQLLTAMLNIVVNAVDAMPKGGTLTIRVEAAHLRSPRPMIDGTDLAPGDFALLTFRDNGTGIPDNALPHVIEPFFTTKPVGKGTGLGLSMVQGFARESGGGLAIASGPTGTTIEVYLPRLPSVLAESRR